MRHLLLLFFSSTLFAQTPLPQTGISGVYEVMVGTRNAADDIRYWREYGFSVVDSAKLSAADCQRIYGVNSALKTYRLQNGDTDSHGLLRLLYWEQPLGPGVGYVGPEVVGLRMAVMLTRDIFRINDIYQMERQNAKKWLPTEPIFDDLYKQTGKTPDFFNRPVGVREMAVYGETFNHVFFQRYGYTIPGYGTVNPNAPLQTSEFTHHDFIVKGDLDVVTRYYSEALGFKPEQPAATLDGDYLKGPRQVFQMAPGYAHYYRGYVSPNNICGKLKFFSPNLPRPDKSERQRIGELGITLHSLYTPNLQMVYELVLKQGIRPTTIQPNEFNERSFTFTGPDGAAWQILEKKATRKPPVTTFELKPVNN
jgi:hypothetical protein